MVVAPGGCSLDAHTRLQACRDDRDVINRRYQRVDHFTLAHLLSRRTVPAISRRSTAWRKGNIEENPFKSPNNVSRGYGWTFVAKSVEKGVDVPEVYGVGTLGSGVQRLLIHGVHSLFLEKWNIHQGHLVHGS